jgi:branched-chain amino acid transport system permease protein
MSKITGYIRSLFEKHPIVKWVTITVLAAILIVLPLIAKNDYIRVVMNLTFIYSMVLFGLNFITGLVGQMNAGMAAIYAVGAYTSALLSKKLGLSPWLGIPAAIVMGIILGVMLGIPSLKIRGIYLVLTTMAFGQIIKLLLNNMVGFTGGPGGIRSIPGYEFFGITISNSTQTYFYYFLLVWTIILALIANTIIKSKWGRAFKGLRDNETAVSTCGINISSIKVKAFILCTVFGCIAGALYSSYIGYLSPDGFSADLSNRFLMILIVGGAGSVIGNVLGAIMITVLPELLKFAGNYYWFVFCIIVLIFVVKFPGGIISLFIKHEDRIDNLNRTIKLDEYETPADNNKPDK